ncbi:ABC transporter permease [Flavobacterium proteolyticum]|uniref:ABC transporter permease n=1 Tax=Flavobacterium proteolyticum TaxID=2911683 RepID=A0ABR9WQV8_9FLAO|nr:ABC transporter permease [Flavobacterium proteolyticum]MBE9576232.1 ABC transporter permease [Flavobacterium proteolyticum]
MKYYFHLQYKMINRSFIEYGMPIILGYFILIFAFILGSKTLFEKVDYANYLYILTYCILILKLSEVTRNRFLKYCFKSSDYKLIRISENILIALPFIAFLIYLNNFLFIPAYLILAIILGFISLKSIYNFIIPTPFSKKPFEFTIGFRNTFYIFLISIFLLFKAIEVTNLNLGIAALISVFLIFFSYYSVPETSFFVWSYNLNPKSFLIEKIKTSILYSSFIVLPFTTILVILFFDKIEAIVTFLAFGYLFLITIILAKYAAYPDKMNIIQSVLLGFCIYFPPLLAIVIPYFYLQSLKQLKQLLK